MARTERAASTFDGSEDPLSEGGNWTNINTGTFGTISKASGVFSSSHASLRAVSRWSGAGTFTDDQYASVVFVETDVGSANYGIGVIARATTNANGTFYYVLGLSDNTYVVGKVVNGSNTTLAGPTAQTWNDNDIVAIEVEGANPNITIRAYGGATGTTLLTTVTSETSIDSGKPGIMAMGDGFAVTGDTWSGGDVGAAGETPDQSDFMVAVAQLHSGGQMVGRDFV